MPLMFSQDLRNMKRERYYLEISSLELYWGWGKLMNVRKDRS